VPASQRGRARERGSGLTSETPDAGTVRIPEPSESNEGFDREELERLREQKAEERGRFDDGVVLKRVE
jgi:hypothetical protein